MVLCLAESPIDLSSLISFLNTQRIKSSIILQSRFLESILRGSGCHSVDVGVHRVEDAWNNVFKSDGTRASHASMVQVLYYDEVELENLYPGSTRHDGDVGVTLRFKSAKNWAGGLNAEEGSQIEIESLALQNKKETTSKMGFVDIIVLLAKGVKSGCSNAVCVGVVMKPSRWQALARRGMFPLLPAKNNVFFIPLDCDALEGARIEECIHVVDVLLHKPTDFLTLEGNGEVSFATKFLGFLNAFSKASSNPIVEPIYKFKPVVNRVCMMECLERACRVAQRKGLDVMVPACVTINDSHHVPVSSLPRAPCIVKPVAACGVPESHRMAIVYPDSTFDWKAIKVPMPAIIQEYINHNATVFKVYVAGEMVFVEQRESLPNLFNSSPPKSHGDCIFYFDSLQRIEPECLPQSCAASYNDPLSSENKNVKADQKNWKVDEEYRKLATILKTEFQLELFGFDVIFDCQHGKAAIIDLNYFPSYNYVEGAASAVQLALKAKVWSELGNAPNMTG
jgi:hypothetical protein